MAARTAQEAVSAFATSFQQALSCVVTGRFNVSGYRPADDPAYANLDGGLPVPLVTGSRLGIVVNLRYRLQQDRPHGPWNVHIAAYRYGLLDDGSRDMVSYEWHPEGASWVTWPHLHIGNSMLREGAPLTARMHLPATYILIKDIVALVIREFGVRPRRRDWEAVLARTRHMRDEAPNAR